MSCPCLTEQPELVEANKILGQELSEIVVTHADHRNLCLIAVVKLLADIATNFLQGDEIQALAVELHARSKPAGRMN